MGCGYGSILVDLGPPNSFGGGVLWRVTMYVFMYCMLSMSMNSFVSFGDKLELSKAYC